jgi:hypothetical protein
MGKRDMIQQSLIINSKIKDYGVVVVSEPNTWTIKNIVVTSLIGHSYWTKMIAIERHNGR